MSVPQFAQCFFFDAEESDRRKVSSVMLLLRVESVVPVLPPRVTVPPRPPVISVSAASVGPDPLPLHTQAD